MALKGRFEDNLRKAAHHAVASAELARDGDCRGAMHWIDTAQRELLRAADSWPRGELHDDAEQAIAILEQASDEVLKRCKRSFGRGRSRRRRRR
jgi:hypothetical protein